MNARHSWSGASRAEAAAARGNPGPGQEGLVPDRHVPRSQSEGLKVDAGGGRPRSGGLARSVLLSLRDLWEDYGDIVRIRWFCGETPDFPEEAPAPGVTWRLLTRSETERWVGEQGSQGVAVRRMHATALESHHDLFVAEQDGRILGRQWIGGGWTYLPRPIRRYVRFPEDMAYFYDGFVAEECRGQGLFGRGLRFALRTARKRGFRLCSAQVLLGNTASLKNWTRLGVPYWDSLYILLARRSLWLGGGGSPWARLGAQGRPRRLPPSA